MSAFEITNLELTQRVEAISNGTLKDVVINGTTQEIAVNVSDTLSGGELANIVEGTYEIPIRDGQVNFLHYEGTGFVDAPTTSTTAIQKTVPAGPITEYNSNVTSIQRGRVVQAYNTSVTDGKVNLSPTPKTGSFGANAAYFLGEVNQAVCAAQVGIMLGKTIDSLLYNANPDYWDSIGMSSLNPETWNSITHGDDSFGASLFNMILGLNPDTQTGQAYIDEQAFAYMAQVLANNGWFNVGNYVVTNNAGLNTSFLNGNIIYQKPTYGTLNWKIGTTQSSLDGWIVTGADASTVYNFGNTFDYSVDIKVIQFMSFYGSISQYFVAKSNLPSAQQTTYKIRNSSVAASSSGRVFGSMSRYTYNEKTVYYEYMGPADSVSQFPNFPTATKALVSNEVGIMAWLAMYGEYSTIGGLDGVTDQPNATLPDSSTWTNPQTTLDSLKQQYPDLWNDALTYDQLQPDGTVKPHTYVPVGFPTTTPNPWTDTQPTTKDLPINQSAPQIKFDDLPDDIVSPITRTVTQPTNDVPTPEPPQNPPDTGSGDSPSPIVPVGSASALWSVYHPTQAQVNAFGGWLWSTDFVDQLIRVFENPMDAVVSLRKVFVTPVDAGNTTIHAGYLDSEVPSAYITQQYVYKDCGYINCYEQFGNVFDYLNTNISIYLPFIGIVPLNTSEIMRSTLHVIYGVDMFTGACLASIEVQRDGNTVTMYQYSGNASVEYPLSGQRASSFLGGLMSLGGAAAMAATGGGSVVAAGMALHGVQQMSTVNVSHSGGFSGNAGAMGIKIPYLIIERPQTKVAQTFPRLAGYPTNHSIKLGECSNHVVVKHVHVEGINATDTELAQIESLLKSGVLV